MKRVLNVGGGSGRSLPSKYEGWDQDLLDIDANVKPDICLDAKEMKQLPASEYDVVFCSHNLEHFYAHEVPKVLAGFLHVLKDSGFAEIAVPNFSGVMSALREGNRDLSDVWYRTSAGMPITFHDVLYGWNHAMERGNLYYAHHCAFTATSLGETLIKAGFASVNVGEDSYNLVAVAYKKEPPCPQP